MDASVAPNSRPPQAGTDPVEPGVLAALVGDNPGTLREFMCGFAVAARQAEDQLSRAGLQERCDDFAAIAHKLKSSARAVGALKLGEICAEIEAAAELDDLAKVRALLLRFGAEAGSVQQWIRSQYGEGNGP